jgi:uncharacterized protein YjbI with pentapeptide repeats
MLTPEDKIRELAGRLSRQKPWLSADECWLSAERAIKKQPWRHCVIVLSGDKERNGWDWADLVLKLSIPILILGLSTIFTFANSKRLESMAKSERTREEINARKLNDDAVLSSAIKDLQPLLIDKDLKNSTHGSAVMGVAKALTLSALSRINDGQKKGFLIRFLVDAGLNSKPGNLISMNMADLNGASLGGVNLAAADLRGAYLKGANLVGTMLAAADLRYAKLDRAAIDSADLRAVSLQKASLQKATLVSADIRHGKLDGSILNSVDLTGADLRMSNMARILAHGANLSSANLRGANLYGANISQARMYSTQLGNANLENATLVSSVLIGADLARANLVKANLRDSDLRISNLSGADLRGANLTNADLAGSNLDGVVWSADTKWPDRKMFYSAKNIPFAIRKQLGL